RRLTGAYVDEQGVAYECDGPGRTFKECAVAKRQVPYTVQRTVREVVKTQVPYTTTRCVRGAYVDDQGVGHENDGPGRHFEECANVKRTQTYTTCRNVVQTRVRKVPYTVYDTVQETCVKK